MQFPPSQRHYFLTQGSSTKLKMDCQVNKMTKNHGKFQYKIIDLSFKYKKILEFYLDL